MEGRERRAVADAENQSATADQTAPENASARPFLQLYQQLHNFLMQPLRNVLLNEGWREGQKAKRLSQHAIGLQQGLSATQAT